MIKSKGPKSAQQDSTAFVDNIRQDISNMRNYVESMVPEGRHRDVALSHLHDFEHWAIQAMDPRKK